MTISDERFFIIAGIVGVALVLLTVGLLFTLRSRKKPNIEESPIDSTPAPSWVKNIAGAAGKTLTGAMSAVTASADAIIVARDAVSNAWTVEVNGQRYQNLKDIHDDKAASKVLAAIEGLRQFAGLTLAPLPAQAPIDKPAESAPIPIVPAGESIPYVSPDSAPKLEPVVVSALTQTAATSKPKYPAPAGSILDQIEKVLQRNLLKEPDLVARRIHMGAEADGSLLIEVDWSTYKSADEVPEVRVRDLIKNSIQEWERTA